MTQPDRSSLTIEESSIRVQTTFDEAKTKRYLRSYIFDDVTDGAHIAALIYTPRTTDAFLSGTTTQRAYNLMKKHVEGPIKQYDIISLMPDLLVSEDLPFAQASFDEINYEFIEETLRRVKETNGVVLCGWEEPGRLMHHLPAYEKLFDQYAGYSVLFRHHLKRGTEPPSSDRRRQSDDHVSGYEAEGEEIKT